MGFLAIGLESLDELSLIYPRVTVRWGQLYISIRVEGTTKVAVGEPGLRSPGNYERVQQCVPEWRGS